MGSLQEEQAVGYAASARLFTLRRGAMQLRVTNWGATITSLSVPDAKGDVADVVLGFDSLTPYMDGTSPYFGCVVGRVANRIAGATFTLNGEVYNLVENGGGCTLHGGKVGYDKVFWDVKKIKDSETPSIQFSYHSADGEQGFPGDLDVSVTYTLSGDMELRTEMEAIARTKATPVSLAQHTYWNLAGHGSGDILGHAIWIWATHLTPVNEHLIPTGELLPIQGTPFDFTNGAIIRSRIDQVHGGYDHNLVLDKSAPSEGDACLAARLKDPGSGRVMELLTNAPGMQFYTGNFVPYIPQGKGGAAYRKHSGLCLETQGFPNAVNQPNFPSVILSPGRLYKHIMVHKFYTEKELS